MDIKTFFVHDLEVSAYWRQKKHVHTHKALHTMVSFPLQGELPLIYNYCKNVPKNYLKSCVKERKSVMCQLKMKPVYFA